jgi:uncharacterized membrane protein YqjE
MTDTLLANIELTLFGGLALLMSALLLVSFMLLPPIIDFALLRVIDPTVFNAVSTSQLCAA